MVITVPVVILFYTFTADSRDQIVTSQINQISSEIVDAAESVYFLGKPSQTTIKVSIPGQIKAVGLDNKELVFNVSTRAGISEIVHASSVDLSGNLPIVQGKYSITVKARDNYVEISYK